MINKHTPGPWRLVKTVTRGEFCWDYKIRSEDDSAICTMGPVSQDANARLIAESPAMLEALRACSELLENSNVRDYIGRKLGEQAALHRALNPLRAIISRVDGKE